MFLYHKIFRMGGLLGSALFFGATRKRNAWREKEGCVVYVVSALEE